MPIPAAILAVIAAAASAGAGTAAQGAVNYGMSRFRTWNDDRQEREIYSYRNMNQRYRRNRRGKWRRY